MNRRVAFAKLAPLYTRIKHPRLFADVSAFCLFIGHGRSGSTLVGALLNAHPDIVLTNELDVIRYLELGLSQTQLYNLIYYFSRRQAAKGSKGGGGYGYAVAGQWQGAARNVRVIGDRKAGTTAIELYRRPQRIDHLRDAIDVPLKFVCVARNPFDSLTTTFKKTRRRPDETGADHLKREVHLYFDRWSAVRNVFDVLGPDALKVVRHEELVTDAKGVLRELCEFLGVEANEQYLADCAGIVYPSARRTRATIDWPLEAHDLVVSRMAEVPWLEGYSFDC